MAIFKGHQVSITDLLQVIPEALLSHLSENTKVDYYSKVLHGKKLFYLLMDRGLQFTRNMRSFSQEKITL